MSLIGPPSGECPVCHRPQAGKHLCSACARTRPLFEGVTPGYANRRKTEQLSMFAGGNGAERKKTKAHKCGMIGCCK